MTDLLITIFLGWLGVHKFMQRKPAMGVLYLLTFGLFGIGWIVDIITAASKLNKPTTKRTTPRTNNVDSFDVAGIGYRTNDIVPIMKKGNPQYSDFVYRVKEDYVQLVPEPQNPHDSNAIAVYMNNVQLGYVPADLTSQIRSLIGRYNFVGVISGGDKYGQRGIIERDFKCEVRIEK